MLVSLVVKLQRRLLRWVPLRRLQILLGKIRQDVEHLSAFEDCLESRLIGGEVLLPSQLVACLPVKWMDFGWGKRFISRCTAGILGGRGWGVSLVRHLVLGWEGVPE